MTRETAGRTDWRTGLVGTRGEERELVWGEDDVLRYALGVGAGQGPPGTDLSYTTENSADVALQVLPTYGVIVAGAAGFPGLDVDPAAVLHAEQAFRLTGPLPVSGRARCTATVSAVHDKGAHAYVTVTSEARDVATDRVLVTAISTLFVRGAGGFGGDRGPRPAWALPDRPADHVVRMPTRPEQALIYRLSGDRNPLHSDPAFAARAGFDRPILHGLCTYGVTGRALLATACGDDVARFGGMHARFSGTVHPGDTLEVSVWEDGADIRFRTTRPDGTVVLDHGILWRTT